MSALRIAQPDQPVRLIDLGEQPWVPLHGHATLRGRAVVGQSGDAMHCPARSAEGQREYRKRRKVAQES